MIILLSEKHTRTNTTIIPKGLLYWDLFLFTIEFLLAITLLYGIAEVNNNLIHM